MKHATEKDWRNFLLDIMMTYYDENNKQWLTYNCEVHKASCEVIT
jgi:hypothetical protein